MPNGADNSFVSRLSRFLGGPGAGVDPRGARHTAVVPGVTEAPKGVEMPGDMAAAGPKADGWRGLPYEFDLGSSALSNVGISLIGNYLSVIVSLNGASMDAVDLQLRFGATSSAPFRHPAAVAVWRTRVGNIWRAGEVFVSANLVAGVTLTLWDTQDFYPQLTDPALGAGSGITQVVVGPYADGAPIPAGNLPVLIGGRDFNGQSKPMLLTDDGRIVAASGLRRIDVVGNKLIAATTTEIVAARALAGFEQGRDIHISIVGGHQAVTIGGPGVTFGGGFTLRSFGGVEPSHWVFRNWDEALVGIVTAGTQTIEYSAIQE